MTALTPTLQPKQDTKPLLLLFSEYKNGLARRMDGFVSHVLQKRHNHTAFRYRVIDQDDRPDLFERFQITTTPTVLVIDEGKVKERIEGLQRPKTIEGALNPWLH